MTEGNSYVAANIVMRRVRGWGWGGGVGWVVKVVYAHVHALLLNVAVFAIRHSDESVWSRSKGAVRGAGRVRLCSELHSSIINSSFVTGGVTPEMPDTFTKPYSVALGMLSAARRPVEESRRKGCKPCRGGVRVFGPLEENEEG